MSQHCAVAPPPPDPRSSTRKLILVGNPNVGKSLLFSVLTGRYVTVSNYPGTTIEITRASGTFGSETMEVIDTPGTNSLIPHSEDEKVTRDIILASPGAHIVQVGDFKNLRRTLFLSLQIAEHGVPFSLCLNMSDEAREHGVTIDVERLAALLGVEVVPTSALRRLNMDRLRKAAVEPRLSTAAILYAPAIESAIARMIPLISPAGANPRALAVAILAGDQSLLPYLATTLEPRTRELFDRIREQTQAALAEPLSYAINRDRLAAVDRVIGQVYSRERSRDGDPVREWLGRMSMHPVWGVPFLAVILFIAWWFVGKLGAGDLVDFVENSVFNRYINPAAIRLMDLIAPFPHVHQLEGGTLVPAYTAAGKMTLLMSTGRFFHDLMVGPYGILTMALTYAIAIVLPVVTTFFIFFGLMEDSGYLPRLAVMLNRIFKGMGLNGKAVLPMVLGLGCDTMATLTTRILETKKEAVIVTLLLALGVPCSAQLGVIMAMLAPLGLAGWLIWSGVIGSTIFLVGWLSSKVVRGEAADFMLEVPPIRTPRLSNILIKVMARTEWYLKEAVPLFVVGTLLLYLLDFSGLLVYFQRLISPVVVGLLHLPEQASNAFLIGFLRRDYGAAGLFMMQRKGLLDPVQTLVSLTVVTLFIPCVANFLMIVKERGIRMASGMAAFILVYSVGTGWLMSWILRAMDFRIG